MAKTVAESWDSGQAYEQFVGRWSRRVATECLVLNFVRDPESMTREMARVTKPGGRVAVYVWDCAGGMGMIPTVFRDFDDYWNPFLGKTGPAATYLASLGDQARERIRLYLESRLAPKQGVRIELTARAWAVQGSV